MYRDLRKSDNQYVIELLSQETLKTPPKKIDSQMKYYPEGVVFFKNRKEQMKTNFASSHLICEMGGN